MKPSVKTFFDPDTFAFTHLISDPATGHAAVIDPVLNYDPVAGAISFSGVTKILNKIESDKLSLKWIFETHVHADHISGAQWLKQRTNAAVVISKNVCKVQDTFNQIYELEGSEAAIPEDFDHLVEDGEYLQLGELNIKVIHTPGHTPSCSTYLVADSAFVGDTLFMPDYGTARCDFPGGDASQLYHSIQKILSLADNTRLLMCHDYMPGGRRLKWKSSVREQKENNIHIHHGISEEAYVKMRIARDTLLSVPKLMLPALQINIRAGKVPGASDRGSQFLKLPLNKF